MVFVICRDIGDENEFSAQCIFYVILCLTNSLPNYLGADYFWLSSYRAVDVSHLMVVCITEQWNINQLMLKWKLAGELKNRSRQCTSKNGTLKTHCKIIELQALLRDHFGLKFQTKNKPKSYRIQRGTQDFMNEQIDNKSEPKKNGVNLADFVCCFDCLSG